MPEIPQITITADGKVQLTPPSFTVQPPVRVVNATEYAQQLIAELQTATDKINAFNAAAASQQPTPPTP